MSFAAQAGVIGSAHDFSGAAWMTSSEACRACHDPHDQGAAAYGSQGLLWDHNLSSQTYTMYTESTNPNHIDAVGNDTEPTGTAKFCLGCHDGSIGVDQYNGNTTGTSTIAVAAQVGAGGNLADTHPIGIVYDAATIAADGQLNPTTTVMAGKTIADFLDGTKVQCGTCHDPHNTSGFQYFLRVGVTLGDNGATASELCLTCHNK